ncbi:retrovirus-related pol polyprotein from transposon TNT 1-94 [Tanacetum coccineum]
MVKNEICAERIAKNANPLALVDAAQQYPDPYYQAPKFHKSFATPSKQASSKRSNASTKFNGKEIAKPITPLSESASKEDSDPEQAQGDKDMQKNLALIAKYFKKIYKPTNNNLRTSSNSRNKNVYTNPSQVVQQTGIQCFNYKEFGHFAKECRKPKKVKDYTYHKEKMLMCKQAKKGIPLQVEQADWLEDTDEEIDEQELEAHLEKDDSNVTLDSLDMCDNDIQTDQNAKDERVALANLIANLKLDVCKSVLVETSRTLGESNSIRVSCLIALQTKQTEFEWYKALNGCIVDYEKLEHKLNETLGLLAQKDIDIKEGLKLKAYEILVVKEKHNELVKQSLLTKSHFEGLVKEKTKIPNDQSDPANRLIPDREETLTLEKESRSKLNKDLVRPYDDTKLNSLYEIFKPASQEYHEQLAHANEIVQLILFIVDSGCTKHMTGNLTLLCNFVEKYLGTVRFGNDQFDPILGYGDLVQGNIMINRVYYVEGLNHNLFSVGQFYDVDLEVAFWKSTCFIRDLQGNDLLTGNRGSDLYIISLQEKPSSTLICLMAKASPTQAWLWHRRLSHLNFDYINLLSKKDVVIGLPNLKYIKDQLCSSYEVNKAKRSSFKTKAVPKMTETSVANDTSGLIPQRQKASDYDNSGPVSQLQNVSPSADTTVPSQQELDLLFVPLYDVFFTVGTLSVNKSSSPTNNSKQQDTPSTTNNPSSTEPTTLTNVNAEENNDFQAEDA